MVFIMNYNINKNIPIPYYYQIQQSIKESIMKGEWAPGDFIPSEREISDLFKVSRITVRKALDNLLLEGLIKKVKGKGTVVSKPKIEEQLFNRLIGTYQDLTEKGYKVDNKILSFNLTSPDQKDIANLNISANDKVFKIERLRYLEGEPYHYSMTSIPQKLCSNFDANLLVKESLINVLDKYYNLKIYKLNRVLEATIATPQEAKLFNIKVGAPILSFYNTALLNDGQPIEFSLNKIRGDMAKFHIEISMDKVEDISQTINKIYS